MSAPGERTSSTTRSEVRGLPRSAIAPYRVEREPLPAELHALERLGVRFRLALALTHAGG